VLTRLASLDPDDFAVRKKLAQLAVAANEPNSVLRWTLEALHIDVRDPAIHQWRAVALVSTGSNADAAEEYAHAVTLSPDDLKLRFTLAETCIKAAQPERAKATILELLKHDADYPGARELLESIQ
jgi:thioredoxin-like negative regulator of GroEL